jgi:hypothetical protein
MVVDSTGRRSCHTTRRSTRRGGNDEETPVKKEWNHRTREETARLDEEMIRQGGNRPQEGFAREEAVSDQEDH